MVVILEMTICGAINDFEFLLDRNGVFHSLATTFEYKTGRTSSVVSWEDVADGSCTGFVNGMQCDSCNARNGCDDGYIGVDINCGNVLNIQDGPTTYSSCSLEEGGVLDIFGWMDSQSWTGCPLISLTERIV